MVKVTITSKIGEEDGMVYNAVGQGYRREDLKYITGDANENRREKRLLALGQKYLD